jgi:hypothetical protein
VRNSCLNNLDTGLIEASLNLEAETLGNLGGATPECGLALLGGLVRVKSSALADGGLALNPEVVEIVFDFEASLGSFEDAPDNDSLNFNGTSVEVIDFDAVGLEVVDPQGDIPL